MISLTDERKELYQWDTNVEITVPAECSQVHFANKIFGRSIDVDVINGKAIIPDVLLQSDNDLNVWAFVGEIGNGYTKISKVFKVNKRNKPADYVFTPTEQMTIKEIAEIAYSVKEDADRGKFNGKNGYTPRKGVDYWTPDDKNEIIQTVLQELPREKWIFKTTDGQVVEKEVPLL